MIHVKLGLYENEMEPGSQQQVWNSRERKDTVVWNMEGIHT